MHFACGEIDVRGLWCEIEKLIIFSRFRPNRVRNRREVDHSGSNALVHASVDVLGVDFENANRPHSSQPLPAPLGTLLETPGLDSTQAAREVYLSLYSRCGQGGVVGYVYMRLLAIEVHSDYSQEPL